MYIRVFNFNLMNARQAKKRAKYCFYIGVADAFLRKLEEITQKAQSGELVSMTISPTTIGLGHNQHKFCKFAAFGKEVLKKHHI